MTAPEQQSVDRLIERIAAADGEAGQGLSPTVYKELREIAAAYFRQQPAGHTLQPTALVHEAYVRLVDRDTIEWRGRGQFLALAARAMRSVLVDHARRKNRAKRGGDWKQVSIDVAGDGKAADPLELLALDEALERLAQLDERQARIVELRCFGGMTLEESAALLGVSRATAAEDWRHARAWLKLRLKEHQ